MNPRGGGRRRANVNSSSSEYSDARYSVEGEEQQNGQAENSYHQADVPSTGEPNAGEYREWSDENYSDAPSDTLRLHADTEGSKGLPRAEMHHQHDRNDATESETEEDEDQRDREIRQDGQEENEQTTGYYDYVAVETENETEEEAEAEPQANELQSDSILAQATTLLETHGVDIGTIGYARISGAGKGAVDYLVRKQEVTIGRLGFGADCQLRSEGRHVSRRHAKVWWDKTRKCWKISCLSRIPFLVNGAPVYASSPAIPLKRRSMIEIGDLTLHFVQAMGTTLCVNNIELLEKRIIAARTIAAYSEDVYAERGKRGSRGGRRGRGRRGPQGSRRGTQKSLKSSSARKGARGKGKGKAGKKVDVRETIEEAETESESEEEETAVDILKEPQFNPKFFPPPSKKRKHSGGRSESQSKRKKRKKSRNAEDSVDEYESADEWTKKEKTEFVRALFAVGVRPVYDANRAITKFEWDHFRHIAPLRNRDDNMITEHYRRFMTDVHNLLDHEEREKKRKGPRTKHKKGCDCIVCENTAKSRQKKRESGAFEASDEDEEEKKALKEDKLLGLVTAQKLRVRMGIHEAASQLDSEAGEAVLARLRNQSSERLKEMPKWWRQGYHDEALMRGVTIHGVGQWKEIYQNDDLEAFEEMREMTRNNDEPSYRVQPTGAAVMKRVRDLANMITSEEKKIAKRRKAMRKSERRRERLQSRHGTSTKVELTDELQMPIDAGVSTEEEIDPVDQTADAGAETEEEDEIVEEVDEYGAEAEDLELVEVLMDGEEEARYQAMLRADTQTRAAESTEEELEVEEEVEAGEGVDAEEEVEAGEEIVIEGEYETESQSESE